MACGLYREPLKWLKRSGTNPMTGSSDFEIGSNYYRRLLVP